MKASKILGICFLIVLIFIGVCGCMSAKIDEKVYENAILTFLKDKYSEEFSILKLYQEFEGNTGVCVRTTCKSEKYADTFTVYCYLDSTMAKETIIVDGKKHSIKDSYPEVLYQNEIFESLGEKDTSSYVLKCNVDIDIDELTKEDFTKGMESCLKDNRLSPCIRFYVITDLHEDTEILEQKLGEVIKKYSPFDGYIYVARMASYDQETALKEYEQNQHDFGNHLTISDFADKVEVILYSADEGLSEKKL